MNQNKKLSSLTLEELIKKKNQAKGAVIGLSIILCIAALIFIVISVNSINSINYALIAVFMGSSVSFIPMIMGLNQIEKEIKSRNQI